MRINLLKRIISKINNTHTFSWVGLVIISALMLYPRLFFIIDQTDKFLKIPLWENTMKAFCNWDCSYYLDFGLTFPHHMNAFFPLYPALLKTIFPLLTFLSPPQVTILASNVLALCLIATLVVLGGQLWKTKSNEDVFLNKPYSAWTLGLAVAIFPHSQFHSYGYSEPLFLILFCVLLIFVKNKSFISAAFCAGLCSVARPQGLWIMGSFLLLFFYSIASDVENLFLKTKKERIQTYFQIILIVGLSILPLCSYLIWNKIETNEYLYFIAQQSKWGRKFNLSEGLLSHIPKYEMNHIFLYISLYAGFRFLKREDFHWKLLGLTSILMAEIPLFIGGYSYSYSRFIASNLGFFSLIVEISRPRLWLAVALILWSVTKLDTEVYKWLTGIGYNGIGP